MANENPTISPLIMDRGHPLGNSEAADGRRALHVKNKTGFLAGIDFDAIKVIYNSSVTESYLYYSGGLSGTLNATVTVTYTDSTKKDIYTVVRT